MITTQRRAIIKNDCVQPSTHKSETALSSLLRQLILTLLESNSINIYRVCVFARNQLVSD